MRRVRSYFRNRGELLRFIKKHDIPLRHIMKMNERAIEFYSEKDIPGTVTKKRTSIAYYVITVCGVLLVMILSLVLFLAAGGTITMGL